MMMPKYDTLPTLAQWKADRYDPFTSAFTRFCNQSQIRTNYVQRIKAELQNDIIMNRIDQLIGLNETRISDAGEQTWLLFDLYQALDYWLKEDNRKKRSKKRSFSLFSRRSPIEQHLKTLGGIRSGAVNDLYFSVCTVMANRFHCSINALPTMFEVYFGKEMTRHGVSQDIFKHGAHYLKRAEAEKYRLIFKDKKVYMLPWWENKTNITADQTINLEIGNTSHAYEKSPDKEWLATKNEAGFAMSMSRTFYVAPHGPTGNPYDPKQFYHSSYLAGQTVLCSGSIVIEEGIVKRLTNKSGHYQPTATHLLHALSGLATVGITNDNIVIELDTGEEILTFETVSLFKTYLAQSGTFETRANDIAMENWKNQQLLRKLRHRKGQKSVKGINVG